MERTEIGEVSRAGRSGGSERCDHHGSEHDPAPPLVLYGGSSGHFSPGGEVNETVRPRGQILREFGWSFGAVLLPCVTSQWSRIIFLKFLARGVLGEAPKDTAPALGDAEADII